MYLWACMLQNMRGNQRTIGWVSSLTWVSGMERRLSSLGASASTHWAISLAPKRKFWMEEAESGNFLTMEFKATEVFLSPVSLFVDSPLGEMDWVQPFGILDLVSLLRLPCLWISYFFPFISPYSIACKCFHIAQKTFLLNLLQSFLKLLTLAPPPLPLIPTLFFIVNQYII